MMKLEGRGEKMILSQTAQYALRALTYLARHGTDEPVRVDTVAEELDLPRNYLSKILHNLTRSGLLDSLRGPNGGFKLTRPPNEIRLVEVVRQFDELEDANRCLLGRPRCSDSDPCSAHERWQEVRATYLCFLEETTLHELSTTSPATVAGLE